MAVKRLLNSHCYFLYIAVVCEDFENEHNDKAACDLEKFAEKELILGLRSTRNRSILGVCEDFENEHNDKAACDLEKIA